MALSRYEIIDPYTLEELRREYQNSSARSRISLLRKLCKNGSLPYEIAALAVEDQNVQVRQWFARHCPHLDYRESCLVDNQLTYKFPERNLEDRLKGDPDPFVRACLCENPTLFRRGEWQKLFNEATRLERLALVRNPRVSRGMIECILDHEEKELGIDLEQREQLVLAYLTNSESLEESCWGTSDFEDRYEDAAWFMWFMAGGHFAKLWKLISKWPRVPGNPQHGVYRYVGADDETKAETYKMCDVPLWRQAILENCGKRDRQTLKLGLNDPDKNCREVANRRVEELDVQNVLRIENELSQKQSENRKSINDSVLMKIPVASIAIRFLKKCLRWFYG
jgi:hypothetical protein